MRFTLVGLVLLVIPAAAFAQAEGEVESMGFDGYYRPNCWTPMKLKLRPKVGSTETYRLQIVQEDLDRDKAMYTRPFTLNGNPEGRTIEERVWVCFLPQPRELAQARTALDLSGKIRVYLCDFKSGRQLVQIPIPPSTTLLRNVDEPGAFGATLGVRLVLVVASSGSQPLLGAHAGARGINEEVLFVPRSPSDLPGNVLGYDAVDAIVWLNADPTALKSDTTAALEEYVRGGGNLLVCQNRDWQKMKESELAALLPVTLTGLEDEKGPRSLRALAWLDEQKRPNPSLAWPRRAARPTDPWFDLADKPIPIARATLKPGAFVNMWSVSDPSSPYLARWMYGLGTVAWAAQDFGDPALLSRSEWRAIGWASVWDKALDWPNDTIAPRIDLASADTRYKDAYDRTYGGTAAAIDLSTAFLEGMEYGGRGLALVTLAVLFFIVYWLVAGPGSYFFLLARRQAHYSWIAFALCAACATGVTALVVRLVLRGPPHIQHVTFVRVSPDGDAVIHSQFGLYIPRDGAQRIELKDTAPKRVSYIAPYPIHPGHARDSAQYPAPLEYEVPMRDRNSIDAPAITVPFRSTLKKFQVRWVGQLNGGINGRVQFASNNPAGKLVNNTGRDLYRVYMIYRPDPSADDMMLGFADGPFGAPAWPNGATLDLTDILQNQKLGLVTTPEMPERTPERLGSRGSLNRVWGDQWAPGFLGRIDAFYERSKADRAALLLSVFDRLAPWQQTAQTNTSFTFGRYELLRRAGRHLDASSAVSCGQLLIVAQSDAAGAAASSPLPFPVHIQGRPVEGRGIVYYQFIVPMDRSGPATMPASPPLEKQDAPATPSQSAPR
jgi:hypothetical protein